MNIRRNISLIAAINALSNLQNFKISTKKAPKNIYNEIMNSEKSIGEKIANLALIYQQSGNNENTQHKQLGKCEDLRVSITLLDFPITNALLSTVDMLGLNHTMCDLLVGSDDKPLN